MVNKIKIKRVIRSLVRSILFIKEQETIEDGLKRKILKLKQYFNNQKISKNEFTDLIKGSGIKKGDTLIVHCAWRGCYMLSISPDDVIEILFDVIGTEGTVLMPCYGKSMQFLDIRYSKSAAGVLSERFRTMNGTIRSEFPHFCMCANGKNASLLIEGHEKSTVSFDVYSPYYKAVYEHDAKILMLGMDNHTVKTPIFHHAAVMSINKSLYYRELYSETENAKVIDSKGNEKNLSYKVLNKNYINDWRKFRRIVKGRELYINKYKGFCIKLIDGKALFNAARDYCECGGEIYKFRRNVTR